MVTRGMHTLLRRPLVALTGALTLAGAVLVGQPASAHPRSPAPPSAPPSARPSAQHSSGYVALGDSYAAGEGLPPFESGTGAVDGCHRSVDQSYPALLGVLGGRQFSAERSVACSGAVTYDIVATRPGSDLAPQISALGARTKTVTLTIGGNDAGFSLIFGDCVYSPDPDLQAALPGGGPGCATRDDQAVSTRIAALAGGPGAPTVSGIVPLPTLLTQVSAAAPRATIYLTGYPRVFGHRPTNAYGCQVNPAAPLFVAGQDATWISDKAAELNSAVRRAAARARAVGVDVRYVDAARAFRGHNLCDRKTPWVNGVVLTSATPPEFSDASFHPTAAGQRAYARSVLRSADVGHGWWSHRLQPRP